MLGISARNGGLVLIGRLAPWMLMPLAVGIPIAVPAGSVPPSRTSTTALTGVHAGSVRQGKDELVSALVQSSAGLPGAPTAVTATATDGQAEVNWTPPRIGGDAPISRYLVTSTPPGPTVTVTGGQTSALINGLSNGERFTFSVAADDASGEGPASLPSNGVTPESLSTFTSTVSMRSVSAMFNGGACVDQGSQCFGIQQNSFVHTATNGEYWVQNLVFVEDTQHGWEAEGNYEIWNGTQQEILACDGAILSGPHGEFCQWPMDWQQLRFPARIKLSSTVADGDVVLKNSLGNVFPAWSPGPSGVQFIVDLHEADVPSMLSLYAPETVIVGETGRHTATFIGGSGSIASQMVLANGQVEVPDTQCVAESSDTSTGESSVGFYWSAAGQGGASLVDFATRGGKPGNGDGVKVLPGSQECS
jgi:fibronectin type III domain protein